MRIVAEVVIINFAAAGERPPHKETRAYGCCVSTLTRFARSPLQGPLTGGRARAAIGFSVVRGAVAFVKGRERRPFAAFAANSNGPSALSPPRGSASFRRPPAE